MTNTNSDLTLKHLVREGTEHLHAGRTAEALSFLERAYALDETHFEAALNLSGAYILSGKFKKAVPILESLRDRDPENAMVWTNLGAAYLGNPVLATDEQQQQAIVAFEQALAIDPVARSVAYNIGLIYRDRQDVEAAKRWFRRAIRHDPRDQHARNHLRRLEDAAGDGPA